jgi:hypothetical protein
MLDRQTLLLIVMTVSMVNGIFSPYLKITIPVSAVLMPELFPRTVQWVLFWSSILLASATLLFSGVPAALYEHWVARGGEGKTAMWIWLAGAALLTLPAVTRFLL